MKEYIEREALKKAITAERESCLTITKVSAYDIGYANGLTIAYSALLNIPAAERNIR